MRDIRKPALLKLREGFVGPLRELSIWPSVWKRVDWCQTCQLKKLVAELAVCLGNICTGSSGVDVCLLWIKVSTHTYEIVPVRICIRRPPGRWQAPTHSLQERTPENLGQSRSHSIHPKSKLPVSENRWEMSRRLGESECLKKLSKCPMREPEWL